MTIVNDIGTDIFHLLIEQGFNVDMAKYITAQAAHESANFSSKVFKRNKNCFGMRDAIYRRETNLGDFDRDGYANYADIEQCVQDYRLYFLNQSFHTNYNTLKEFVLALKENGYFEASLEEYLNGVTRYYNLYFRA